MLDGKMETLLPESTPRRKNTTKYRLSSLYIYNYDICQYLWHRSYRESDCLHPDDFLNLHWGIEEGLYRELQHRQTI